VGESDEHFIVPYSLTAFPSIPTMVGDLETLADFTSASGQLENVEEGGDEDTDN
jgi:hypothetical protein